MTTKLGTTQCHMLKTLKDHNGHWYAGCGWVWDNPSTTMRILDSLEKRGLMRSSSHGKYGKSYTLVIGWEKKAERMGYRP